MTIYKSRQVNSDPYPWRDLAGDRHQGPVARQLADLLDPRPEFNATRDPEPWVGRSPVTGDLIRLSVKPAGLNEFRWSPRIGTWHGFDTPVNPILVEFRTGLFGEAKYAAIFWLDWIKDSDRFTPEQIDHARRVLTRLANWSAS